MKLREERLIMRWVYVSNTVNSLRYEIKVNDVLIDAAVYKIPERSNADLHQIAENFDAVISSSVFLLLKAKELGLIACYETNDQQGKTHLYEFVPGAEFYLEKSVVKEWERIGSEQLTEAKVTEVTHAGLYNVLVIGNDSLDIINNFPNSASITYHQKPLLHYSQYDFKALAKEFNALLTDDPALLVLAASANLDIYTWCKSNDDVINIIPKLSQLYQTEKHAVYTDQDSLAQEYFDALDQFVIQVTEGPIKDGEKFYDWYSGECHSSFLKHWQLRITNKQIINFNKRRLKDIEKDKGLTKLSLACIINLINVMIMDSELKSMHEVPSQQPLEQNMNTLETRDVVDTNAVPSILKISKVTPSNTETLPDVVY